MVCCSHSDLLEFDNHIWDQIGCPEVDDGDGGGDDDGDDEEDAEDDLHLYK